MRAPLLAAIAVLLSAPATAHSAASVRLEALGANAVPQDRPFRFTAHVRNPARTFTEAEVSFRLERRSGGVSFQREVLVVPGRTTVPFDAGVAPATWFAGLGRYRVVALLAGRRAAALSFRVTRPRLTVPRFVDVTEAAGLATTVPGSACGRWTNGAAWADVDRDGALDLFLPRQGQPEQLFMGRGDGTFRDEAAARGVAGGAAPAIGASFADYDGDGDADLHVVAEGPDSLFRNDGTGHFTDVAAAAGVAGTQVGASASWADYDGDGRLDLYVTNHSRCLGSTLGGGIVLEPDRLYRNRGDGTFSDETAVLEGDPLVDADGTTRGAGFQAAWFDYDDDRRPDLYLGNDFLTGNSDRNHLWHNDGGGRFTDVSVASRTAHTMNSMGIAVGDFDRDLRLDFAVSNVESNRLFRNLGDGRFADVPARAGVDRPFQRATKRSVTWGLQFADLDLDGWEDLYVAAGYIAGYLGDPATPQRNELFVNRGDGTFADLSGPSGADDPGQSRGVALADYDRDGRIDVYVVNQGGVPRLYRNVTPLGGRHWLEIDTVGTTSNRDGCGAHVVVGTMLREVLCGSTGVSSSSDPTLHFGLGRKRVVRRVVIRWPSGVRQVLRNVRADRRITVTEPARAATARVRGLWYGAVALPRRSAVSADERRELARLQRRRGRAARRIVRRWSRQAAVVPWTRLALRMITTHRPRPPFAARALALVETAMHDAAVQAGRLRPRRPAAPIRPLVRGSSLVTGAAVAGAAEDVLAYLFPAEGRATFVRLADDAAMAPLWAGVAHRGDVEAARALGRAVAKRAIARGESDGHRNTGFSSPRLVGEAYWTPTPASFEPPIGGPVGGWRPWLMSSAGALRERLAGPSAYGSPAFMAQLREVLDVHGALNQERKEIATFWDDGPGTFTPAGHWFDFALGLVARLKTVEAANVLARLGAAEADVAIAVFEAKYHWWSIRPVTAVWRLCDGGTVLCTDAELDADPARAAYRGRWAPYITTPAFPSYPSGHSAFSGAAARVLGRVFPATRRTVDRLARQAADSRLYGGIHFAEDNEAGLRLGRAVADLALDRPCGSCW